MIYLYHYHYYYELLGTTIYTIDCRVHSMNERTGIHLMVSAGVE